MKTDTLVNFHITEALIFFFLNWVTILFTYHGVFNFILHTVCHDGRKKRIFFGHLAYTIVLNIIIIKYLFIGVSVLDMPI